MKKKLMVAAMVAMPMLGMFGGNDALAAVVNTGDGVDGTNNPVKVTASHSSTFSVVIPKEITLENTSGSDYSSKYTVKVTGDIAGNETVTVEPAVSTFELQQTNKSDLNAEVVQTDVTATGKNLEDGNGTKEMNGTVTAQGVKAGNWAGTFNFNIDLN